jgi:putative flippase GtrA
MVVGGIGYFINMAIYFVITPLFHSQTKVLGQEYYLPPFLISSYIAITSNYILNKRYTFQDRKEHSIGYGRYLIVSTATLVIDVVILFALVKYLGLIPQLAAMLAILIAFILRYYFAKKWVWGELKENKEYIISRF